MNKIYATYRKRSLNDWAWLYSPSYFFDKMFSDYLNAWLSKINDQDIRESQYTSELVPWVPKLTRFMTCEYNGNYITQESMVQSLNTTGSEFYISIFETVEEARQRIRDNTNLVELEPWKFEIFNWDNPQWFQTDPIYLIIE